MLKLLGAIAVLAALRRRLRIERADGGPPPRRAATATPAAESAEPVATGEPSRRATTPRCAPTTAATKARTPIDGDVEAEYHQPPRPATGGIGDAITLTGTNIGVRLRTTVTGLVDPARDLRIAAARDALCRRGPAASQHRHRHPRRPAPERAADATAGGRTAKPVLGVKASCSNGFDGTAVRIDVGARGARLPAVRGA